MLIERGSLGSYESTLETHITNTIDTCVVGRIHLFYNVGRVARTNIRGKQQGNHECALQFMQLLYSL